MDCARIDWPFRLTLGVVAALIVVGCGKQGSPPPGPPEEECEAGFVRTAEGCVDASPCSIGHPAGRCPEGSSCDAALGYCASAPSLPCLTLWEVDGSRTETPLCAALHSREFLEARSGIGRPSNQYLIRFDRLWRDIDVGYGAFEAAAVDWNEIKSQYRPRAEQATSRYEQLDLIVRMFNELHDGHTGYYDLDACDDLTAMKVDASPFEFSTTLVDDEVIVYRSTDDRVAPGDRIVSVNGLSGATLRRYFDERLKCTSGYSSPSVADKSFGASVLALAVDPLFIGSELDSLLGVVVEGSDGGLQLLRPNSASEVAWQRMRLDNFAYYEGLAPVQLSWRQYDTGEWGGHAPGYIGHALVDEIAYMVLYDFLGEDDFAAALREVIQLYPTAKGWLIDVRMNLGGGPHEETLASFFLDEAIAVPRVELKAGYAHDAFSPCFECPETIAPDPSIHVAVPVAVLTSAFTASAGDNFAYEMKQAPRARLFGEPTFGAFGNISQYPDQEAIYTITWTRVSDTDGTRMQGRSIVPHETIWLARDDLRRGVDTVVERAKEWLLSEPF